MSVLPMPITRIRLTIPQGILALCEQAAKRIKGGEAVWFGGLRDVLVKALEESGIPPEFLRQGRFDDIFFVGLPAELLDLDLRVVQVRSTSMDVLSVSRWNLRKSVKATCVCGPLPWAAPTFTAPKAFSTPMASGEPSP